MKPSSCVEYSRVVHFFHARMSTRCFGLPVVSFTTGLKKPSKLSWFSPMNLSVSAGRQGGSAQARVRKEKRAS
jgi:hypothetical protein